MSIKNEAEHSESAPSALAWVLILVAAVITMGLLCFCFAWANAERQRDAEYKQGWNYAGASEVLKMYPHEPAAHSAMASVWMKQKQYRKAAAEYGKAVKLEPKNPYNHLDLGNALSLCGDIALDHRTHFVKRHLDDRACSLTGLVA